MLGSITVALVLIPWMGRWIPGLSGVSRFFVDVFSPVSLRNIAYETANHAWYSSIAYAIGAIVITGLLIAVVTTYLRNLGERYRNGRLDRYDWRGHVLFLGYDEMMIGTLQKICAAEKQVVVAVPENAVGVKNRLRAMLGEDNLRHVEVIESNKTSRTDLEKKACVAQATHLFIVGQQDDAAHDATNIKALDTVGEIVDEKSQLVCCLYLQNRASLSLVQRQGFEGDGSNWIRQRVNPFNFYENTATELLTNITSDNARMDLDYHSKTRNLAVCPEADVHLVVLGMTEMGMALAREVLMVAHYPGHRVTVTLVDEKAREEMFYFTGRYKEFFKHCNYTYEDLDSPSPTPVIPTSEVQSLVDVDFQFVQCSIAHPRLLERLEAWSRDERRLLTLAICTADPAKNMATALYLPHTLLMSDNPVWVYQHGDDSMQEFSRHNYYRNIHTFSPNKYSCIDLQSSPLLQMAEEMAHAYATASDMQSKTWADMTQYERWSSLYNARSIVTKLRAKGYEIRWENGGFLLWKFALGEKVRCGKLEFTDDEIRLLSETEHIRWNADTLAKGFRPTTLEEKHLIHADKTWKNRLKAELFAHDDLRPYADLNPGTAAYDHKMTVAMIEFINSKLKTSRA